MPITDAMLRLARSDAPGVLHHVMIWVMIRGIERRKIFRDNKERDDFIERLSVILPTTNTSCYAWSFISNHTHFLLMQKLSIFISSAFNGGHP